MSSKIRDIYSFKKIRDEIKDFKTFLPYFDLPPFNLLFSKDKLQDINKKLNEIENNLENFSSVLDKFNEYFSNRGWIAYESMYASIHEKTVALAEKGKIDEAEVVLVEFYESEEFGRFILLLAGIDEFDIRMELINLAYNDYKQKRYYSCIPILLMMIDGFVNDITKNKGFFSEGADLTAWDSIAGHESGLQVIKEIMTKTRNATNNDSIYIPYRNGILHGRDLGYANKFVAAKCWNVLFVLRDWAMSLKKGNKNPPPPDPIKQSKSFDETIQDLFKTIEYVKKIKSWKPTELIIGKDIPEKGEPDEYKINTAEREIVLMIHYWKIKNYGKMASKIHDIWNVNISVNKYAGLIKNILKTVNVMSFRIISVKYALYDICNIKMNLELQVGREYVNKDITFHLFFKDNENNYYTYGDTMGSWMVKDFTHIFENMS